MISQQFREAYWERQMTMGQRQAISPLPQSKNAEPWKIMSAKSPQMEAQTMMVIRMRAIPASAMEILSRSEMSLQKGSFYWLDLLISSRSITLLAALIIFLPFLTKPLKSFSDITPLRYFSLALYWLVLKPQVLVRQGTTTSDQLVVGICLLLMRSLYLSGLGRNSSLISSLTSLELRNIYLEIIINKRFLFKGEEERSWK